MPDKIRNSQELIKVADAYKQASQSFEREVLVCGGAGCVSSSCLAVRDALAAGIREQGLEKSVRIVTTGCMGLCAAGPLVLVRPGDILYTAMTPEKIAEVVARHLLGGEIVEEYTFYDPELEEYVPRLSDIRFFSNQVKIALRNCGDMDYSSIEAYIARDGYQAIASALAGGEPQRVIDTIKVSGLRGRGGAGFPAGVKWQAAHDQKSDKKYIVCNADEGDPGAFMDRSLLEGDPHSIIEGMQLGGFAIGADKGYVYVRAEYPMAIERLQAAIEQARQAGLLGTNILGSGFNFDLEIRIGAGAFVCGEETSLIASIEGERGEPRQKPPLPFERGLFGKPTIINNVETLANIAAIILKGADWYRSFGTEKSAGTKVFALAGHIVNTGIIEVPMGVPLGDIIYKIGGGLRGGKKFKAIQSGGPSGGCLTKAHLNTPVDYENLAQLGAIMGSGGLVVMNEDTCMVDTARYFMDFIRDESCGKCLPCRVGTKRMLEILENITEGKGKEGDIELLEELAETLKQTAMCGLGQTASNPVLSTLRYFRDEYESHIHARHCSAGVCAELQSSPCRNACPANVFIPGYMTLAAKGMLSEAYQLIRQENPFPAVCGRVCTHPCETHCRRSQVDEALAICSVKRFIGDYALRDDYDVPFVESLPPTGKRVAVVGSGPSGLSCAYYLANNGHEVEVYECEKAAGGAMYWAIPDFRLPKEVLAREIRAVEAAGVAIHLGVRVGTDISFDQLRRDHDAVYIAVGSQKSRTMNIPGENLAGAESALAFLRRIGLELDRSVPEKLVVVGGGSTAMDVARSALRLGAKEATVVYRRTESQMSADREEIVDAREEGVRIIALASPVEVLGENGKVTGVRFIRREMGDFGPDGRRRSVPIKGSEFVLDCDGVVAAINQDVDTAFYESAKMQVDTKGALAINRFTAETAHSGVFAGGDVSPWTPNVIINAIADGKRAAVNIDKYLGGDGSLNKGTWFDITLTQDPEVTEPHGRFPVRTLPVKERMDNFREVSLGFHKLDALAETLRCLHCERRFDA